MKKFCLYCAVLLPVIALDAKPRSQRLEVLHPAVGPVLDSTENKTFKVFEGNAGFTTARLYRVSNKSWMLHIAGVRDGQAWLLTERLNMTGMEKIKKRIAWRIKQRQNDSSKRFDSPIHSIREIFTLNLKDPIEMKLVDGSELIGRITNIEDEKIHFVTVGGARIDILDEQVYQIHRRLAIVSGQSFFRQDPNQVRLFFGPTGRTLRKGEGNLSDFYILFPTVAVGITDQFMLGGGVSIIPFADSQIGYISPKVRLHHSKGLDVAAGMLYMGAPGREGFGAAYTALSTGSPAGGITLGAAIPFDLDGGIKEKFVALLLGGEKQVSEGLKLITENWLFTGNGESLLVVSGGFRFISEKLTVGLGFFTVPELIDEFEGFPFIPWLDFSLSFGRLQ